MKCYASAMGKGRNRDALAALPGWGILIEPHDLRESDGFEIVLDSGAWWANQRGLPFDEEAFDAALERFGGRARFVVLPDIVAGGKESLALSLRYMNRVRSMCDLVLIAVQNGMEPADLAPHVGRHVGIFLGGSTEWKLETMEMWGKFCAQVDCEHPLSTPDDPVRGCWYHVARVNTIKRYTLANAAGADSVDGSSASKYATTLPLLENGRRQPDLYAPKRLESA